MQTKISTEQIDKDILPEFLRLLNKEYDDECNEQMSFIFGQFLSNLPLEKQRKSHANEFMNYYMKVCRSKETIVRTNGAFNLPCMFYYFRCYEEELEADFIEYYIEFCHDENANIRWIIGKSLHEAIVLEWKSERNPFDFYEAFEKLVKDEEMEVKFSVIQNLSETVGALF